MRVTLQQFEALCALKNGVAVKDLAVLQSLQEKGLVTTRLTDFALNISTFVIV